MTEQRVKDILGEMTEQEKEFFDLMIQLPRRDFVLEDNLILANVLQAREEDCVENCLIYLKALLDSEPDLTLNDFSKTIFMDGLEEEE